MARIKRVAVVLCQGGKKAKSSGENYDLAGLDCRKALEKYPAGIKTCTNGCLGLGSCVAACKKDAIHIGANGVAVVDREKCVGCGLCVRACPQTLIKLVDEDMPISIRCSTQLAGAPKVREACEAGCISCRICEKNCPVGAITVKDGHAIIDYDKCVSCGMCATKCPRGVIVDAYGIFTPKPDEGRA